jgi:hypothetical protein
MALIEHSFSLWEEGAPDALAMRDLLSMPGIWQQQRTDAATQAAVIGAKYHGAFVSVLRLDGVPQGFMIFLPQKCGLYETHLAMRRSVGIRAVVALIRFAVVELFAVCREAGMAAAPCPDWNLKLARIAAFVKNLLLAGNRAIHAQYRVKTYAMRDGESWGATVVPVSRKECSLQIERREAQCH